ncbi:hypothetical protein D3C86_1732680 [compost metagenome]
MLKLDVERPFIGNKALLFFEKNNQNLGVNATGFGDIVNDLSCGSSSSAKGTTVATCGLHLWSGLRIHRKAAVWWCVKT